MGRVLCSVLTNLCNHDFVLAASVQKRRSACSHCSIMSDIKLVFESAAAGIPTLLNVVGLVCAGLVRQQWLVCQMTSIPGIQHPATPMWQPVPTTRCSWEPSFSLTGTCSTGLLLALRQDPLHCWTANGICDASISKLSIQGALNALVKTRPIVGFIALDLFMMSFAWLTMSPPVCRLYPHLQHLALDLP